MKDGRPLVITGEDGRAAVEIALAGYRSAALHTATSFRLSSVDPVYQRGIAGLSELPGASADVVNLYGLGLRA